MTLDNTTFNKKMDELTSSFKKIADQMVSANELKRYDLLLRDSKVGSDSKIKILERLMLEIGGDDVL